MKFNDEITLDLAKAVADVMEGKDAPVKFNVVDSDGEVVKGFNTKEAANKYVTDNKDTKLNIVVAEVDEPRVPDGNMGSKDGETNFKKKHAVKKSGENPDGSVTKEEVEISIDELNEKIKKPGRGKASVDADFIGDNKMRADAKRKYKVDIKPTGNSTADLKGDKAQLVKFLQDPEMYGMDDSDIEELFPELFEAKVEEDETEAAAKEESEKQKKYQAFFQSALKKFGVKSPAELDDTKKKEFFDYVDKNYQGDNEAD